MIVMARRNRFHVRTGRFGLPRRTGQRMTAHDGGASTGKCDANIVCLRAPCFQVELETPHAHRQANACAYHVADVIQAVRAWAAAHGVADGQLTILAIEPAAGGRQPDPGGFAFSKIPLGTVQRRSPETAE